VGTLRLPKTYSVCAMARVLADNKGIVPAELDPSVSGHIRACLSCGLLQRRTHSVWVQEAGDWAQQTILVPTREGWDRIAEVAEAWPYDENARTALRLRTHGWSGLA
jgi:hypothetical protein